MKSLKFVLPCLLAVLGSANADAAPFKSARGILACADFADHQKHMALMFSGDTAAYVKFFGQAQEAKRCLLIPAGTEIFVDKTNGRKFPDSCIRIRGEVDCAWTQLGPQELQAAGTVQ